MLEAFDRGGPIRVRMIMVALVTSFLALVLLPHRLVAFLVPLFWVVVHVRALWTWLHERNEPSLDADDQNQIITLSDSTTNRQT